MTGSQFDNNPQQRGSSSQQSPAASRGEMPLAEASFGGEFNPSRGDIVPVEQVTDAGYDASNPHTTIPLESILDSFPVGGLPDNSLQPLADGRVSSETVRALSPLAIAVQSMERAPTWTEGVVGVEQYLSSLPDDELVKIVGEIQGSRTTLGLVRALLTGRHTFSTQELTVNSLAQLEQANRQT